MIKRLGFALALVVAALAGAGLWAVASTGMRLEHAANDISYAEFTSIILTALGVLIAVLGLLLGALAIVGWATFQRQVAESSERYLAKQFDDEGQAYRRLVRELKEDVVRAALEGVGQAPIEEEPADPDVNDLNG